MKKFLSLLLAVTMLASMFVIPTQAAEDPELVAVYVSEPVDGVTNTDDMPLPAVTFVFENKANTGLEARWGMTLNGVTHDATGAIKVDGTTYGNGYEGGPSASAVASKGIHLGWKKSGNLTTATFFFPFSKAELNAAGYNDYYDAAASGAFTGFIQDVGGRDGWVVDVKANTTKDGADASVHNVTTENVLFNGYTREGTVYLTKNNAHPDSTYFVSMSLNGQNVPAEYTVNGAGYTFEYDVKLNGDYDKLGFAYLDDENFAANAIWTTIPWELTGVYFGGDLSDIAYPEWGHCVVPAHLAGNEATTILLGAAGSGTNGETAVYKNFCVKNPEGEVVWELDVTKAGNIQMISGNACKYGYAFNEVAPETPVTKPVTEAPETDVPYAPVYPEISEGFAWGVAGIDVDMEARTWRVDLYIDNPTADFWGDAWFGIYDRSVDQALFQNTSPAGNVGFSAWDYVFPGKTVASGRTTFSITSENGYYKAGVNNPGNLWLNTYPMFDSHHYDLTGCENLQIILFYTDGQGGYGYQIADTVDISLAPASNEPTETEAPVASEPAASEPAVTEAPATEAPATEAPETEAPKQFAMGVTSVTIDEATGYWRVDLWAENFVGDFKPDAWFGVYDRSVTQEMLSTHRGSAGLSTWAYIKTSLKDSYGDGSVPSGRIEFYIDSTNPTGLGGGNLWIEKYGSDGLMEGAIGLDDLKIVVFYSDGQFGIDGYIVAGEADFSLVPETPATEAPATEAPATEAPATEAPATEAPATEAPATEAPETEAPVVDNADELVGDYFYVEGEKVANYYGLVLFEGNYYYVDAHGKIVKNTAHYVLNVNGYNVVPGMYGFDENGVMYVLNGLVDFSYYVEGVKAPSYYGLVEVDGAYYYIDKDARAVTGKLHYVMTTNGLTWADGTAVATGWYEFDANGALVNPGVRNGLVGDFYYVDDVKQGSYYGLVEIDGSFYYVDKDAKIVKGKDHYVQTTNGLLEAGLYTFDANGVLVA